MSVQPSSLASAALDPAPVRHGRADSDRGSRSEEFTLPEPVREPQQARRDGDDRPVPARPEETGRQDDTVPAEDAAVASPGKGDKPARDGTLSGAGRERTEDKPASTEIKSPVRPAAAGKPEIGALVTIAAAALVEGATPEGPDTASGEAETKAAGDADVATDGPALTDAKPDPGALIAIEPQPVPVPIAVPQPVALPDAAILLAALALSPTDAEPAPTGDAAPDTKTATVPAGMPARPLPMPGPAPAGDGLVAVAAKEGVAEGKPQDAGFGEIAGAASRPKEGQPEAVKAGMSEAKPADGPQPPIDLSFLTQTRAARAETAIVIPASTEGALAPGAAQAHGASTGPATPIHVVPLEIGLQALAGSKRFDIRLDPAELGRVDVNLEISDKGEVTARLVVDRVETLHMLQRDARTLERAFEQAGLKPSDAGVEITLRDPSDQSGFRQNRHDDEASRRSRSADKDGDDHVAAVAQPAPARRLLRLGGVDLSI